MRAAFKNQYVSSENHRSHITTKLSDNTFITKLDFNLLDIITGMSEIPSGAFNIRKNSECVARTSLKNIRIEPKKDVSGIDIYVDAGTKGETIYIPVIITNTGLSEMVYNDFHIGENADVKIVAGCGIHNDGNDCSRHDGVHTFYIGKGASVKYEEKHVGEGGGTGERVMNPATIIHMDSDSVFDMVTEQIRGITSTIRTTNAYLKSNAKLNITEKLLTHENQTAKSDVEVTLDGEASRLQIVSRSVAKGESRQIFHPKAIGNCACHAHIQCDSIIMDDAKVSSIPEIAANSRDAEIIHEAAIGRINNEQVLKLQTLGLNSEEAEAVIIEGFLS